MIQYMIQRRLRITYDIFHSWISWLNRHVQSPNPWSPRVITHRIRMYAIYGNISHQYTPVMLASIYHTTGSVMGYIMLRRDHIPWWSASTIGQSRQSMAVRAVLVRLLGPSESVCWRCDLSPKICRGILHLSRGCFLSLEKEILDEKAKDTKRW